MVFAKTNQLSGESEDWDNISLKQEALLKHLVRKVESFTPLEVLQPTGRTGDEVIFNLDIDGTHYYLVRRRQKPEESIRLSPRERAIAKLVAQGFSNKCIGNQLNISPWTVATYLRRIFAKLTVSSRTAMITRLLEENLLQD